MQQIMEKLTDNRQYMEAQFTKLNKTIENLTTRVTGVERKQSEFENTIEFLHAEFQDIKKQMTELADKQKLEDDKLKRQVSVLQEARNQKTLRISGIPHTNQEDLHYLIGKLAAAMECPISKSDIDTIYRIKAKDDKQSSAAPIIVRFNNMDIRDEFYNGRKSLGKNDITTNSIGLAGRHRSKIFINEYLSRQSQALFYAARKKRAELSYQYIWTFHGQIYMRKSKSDDSQKISSPEDLENLQ